jgi:hypothetical protein
LHVGKLIRPLLLLHTHDKQKHTSPGSERLFNHTQAPRPPCARGIYHLRANIIIEKRPRQLLKSPCSQQTARPQVCQLNYHAAFYHRHFFTKIFSEAHTNSHCNKIVVKKKSLDRNWELFSSVFMISYHSILNLICWTPLNKYILETSSTI